LGALRDLSEMGGGTTHTPGKCLMPPSSPIPIPRIEPISTLANNHCWILTMFTRNNTNSESIQAPRLFPHFVTLQLYFYLYIYFIFYIIFTPFCPQFRGIQLLVVTIFSHRYNSHTGSGETKVESHASSETQLNQAALLLNTGRIQPGSQPHQCVGDLVSVHCAQPATGVGSAR
jgi:hypothetical protein